VTKELLVCGFTVTRHNSLFLFIWAVITALPGFLATSLPPSDTKTTSLLLVLKTGLHGASFTQRYVTAFCIKAFFLKFKDGLWTCTMTVLLRQIILDVPVFFAFTPDFVFFKIFLFETLTNFFTEMLSPTHTEQPILLLFCFCFFAVAPVKIHDCKTNTTAKHTKRMRFKTEYRLALITIPILNYFLIYFF
jgi:hypothetical protein